MASHEDVAYRWMNRALNGQQYANALKSANLHDEGDAIYSYGHHFEVGRVLRDKGRNPVGWLLNGNTYSVTTSRHQSAVRRAVQGRGLPTVIIPHAALDAASIDYATVQIVHVQPDWDTVTQITKFEAPGHLEYEKRWENGGWRNSKTGEFVERDGRWNYSTAKPKQETCERCVKEPPFPSYVDEQEGVVKRAAWHAALQEHRVHVRLRHGEWEDVPGRDVNTGRARRMSSRSVEWEIIDFPESPTGVVYVREVRRHWLGASLIRAAVPYQIRVRHKACDGTGVVDPWFTIGYNEGEGPLDREQSAAHDRHLEWVRERNGGMTEPVQRFVNVAHEHRECRGCSGTGRVSATRRRWAYFLSGFDTNETRPSYFFCELPPKVQPFTVSEAYETLKPESVKLAESMGREVKRQGDIFAIPMPELTLAELKKQGGTIRRRKVNVEERTIWDRRSSRTVNVRETEYLALVLGTNHEATEVVDMPNGQTYARGTMTHEPGNRPRDHKRLVLGKTWHLVVKNTVPIGA